MNPLICSWLVSCWNLETFCIAYPWYEMLTKHQRFSMTFTWGQFHKKWTRTSSITCVPRSHILDYLHIFQKPFTHWYNTNITLSAHKCSRDWYWLYDHKKTMILWCALLMEPLIKCVFILVHNMMCGSFVALLPTNPSTSLCQYKSFPWGSKHGTSTLKAFYRLRTHASIAD